MRAKYFTAAEAEDCYAAAEAYFAAPRDTLYCRLAPAEQDEGFLLLVIDPGPAGVSAVDNMDAFFTLSYTDEGVLLQLFSAHGQGAKLSHEELALYLKRKTLWDLNKAALALVLDKGWGLARIAPAQAELTLNEEAVVSVDKGETKAYVTIWPADEGGKALDMEAVQAALRAAGVAHGLDKAALSQLLREKTLYKNYLVAQATPPEPGQNGYLTFHFRREFDARPKEEENGRVDYRTLDLFESVKVDQLLVTRTLATPGISGHSVTGRELPPTPGKNVPLPGGKNIRVDGEKTALYAAANGMVVYADGRVNVSNVYHVNGDADMTVGNIDFDGSVVISGHVISGLTIKASGNIEVGGVVEGATISAGGNIMLHHGMQGMNKGCLEAGGSVTANYIERATVMAGANITANIIAHSTVEAGDSLYLTGKNGSLVGGQARVSNVLSAQVIGSVTETITEVEVGLVPHKRSRLLFLQQELNRLPEEIEKLSTIAGYLQANPSDDPKKVAMGFSVTQSLKHNSQLLAEYSAEFTELSEESANAIHGKVHVFDTAHRGARLTIASATYRVLEPTAHCTFKIADGTITFGVYEG